jgi:hypothetical protein
MVFRGAAERAPGWQDTPFHEPEVGSVVGSRASLGRIRKRPFSD